MTTNYLDALAEAIYAEADSDLPLTGEDWPLYRLYAVLALAKGTQTTPRDAHNAWAAWAAAFQPNHRSLVPYDMLTPEVQALDQPYVDAIHAVARRVDRCAESRGD